MRLLLSRDFGDSDAFLNEILELDSLVYASELQGTFKSVSERYYQNRDSFIIVQHGPSIIGYFCFFPICDELHASMQQQGSFFDDDIRPEQILPYQATNNLFFISTVVRPEFQDGIAIRMLFDGFRQFIIEKEDNGQAILSLSAYITSAGGVKLATRLGMSKAYDIDASYAFYRADRKSILDFCHGK